jgi:3-dehydrotetronate 4-kinase
MLIGCIADDFTGASDIANTLAKAGMSAVQTVGIPDARFKPTSDACVISLKSRSIPASDAVRQSLASMEWLLAQGCQQIIFKYCSTFDSTPDGNIGPVAEALAKKLGVRGVVICPAFPGAGRRIYQGHLFVNDRLLNESGMENHPLNPMSDPNIRRWLSHQTASPVGLVPHSIVSEGAKFIHSALTAQADSGHTLVVVDAGTDTDLLTIGKALAGAKLVTGGSGIAMGLPANFFATSLSHFNAPTPVAMFGPAAVLSGSCSRATLGQIEHHIQQGYPVMRVGVKDILSGKMTAQHALTFWQQNRDSIPLICSSEPSEQVALHQQEHDGAKVAHAIEQFFATSARLLVEAGVKRLVVAGGETSGAVVSALEPRAFRIGPEIDPGVPALECDGAPNIGLVLKSGNFGQADFFERATKALGAAG